MACRMLDLDDDTLYEVCRAHANLNTPQAISPTTYQALQDMSMVCRRLRVLLAPLVLRSLGIGHCWLPVWKLVEYLFASTPVLLHTRHLTADFGRDPDANASMLHVAQFLPRLQQLVSLDLYLPKFAISSLEAAFTARRSALPHLRTLVISPLMLWMVAWCPNMEHLSLTNLRQRANTSDISEALASSFETIREPLRGVKSLNLAGYLSVDFVEQMLEAMPNLEVLCTKGFYLDDEEAAQRILLQCPRLKSLDVTCTWPFYYAFPQCVEPIFSSCPSLQQMLVGSETRKMSVYWTEDGSLEAKETSVGDEESDDSD